MAMHVSLREIRDDDLDTIFAWGSDPEALHMAAFTAKDPTDRGHFDAHWARIRRDPSVVARAIVAGDGQLVGHAGAYGPPDEREVTYWVGREFWGRGVATAALRAMLEVVPERPLHGRAAADNVASIRVLEACGFVLTGTARGHANARGEEIDEVILVLEA